jgi:hypothetical protein
MVNKIEPSASSEGDLGAIPGPKGVEVPGLRGKLDSLMLAYGRKQQWLAEALSTSSPTIAGWKASGRMPANQLAALCAMLEVQRGTLLDPDPARFAAWLEQFQSVGSGQRWNALLNTCDHRGLGLGLVRRVDPGPPRLRGVRPDRLGPPTLGSPPDEISMSDKPVFELDPACLPGTCRWQPGQVILVLQDPERTQCLCPSRDRGGFVEIQARWRFPGAGVKPLGFAAPIGPHRAVAVVTRDPLPEGLRVALTDDAMLGDPLRIRPALDRLALWLVGGGDWQAPEVPHAVRSFRFVLLPPRPGGDALAPL